MKAYGVHDKNWYSDYTLIVFAETAGKAKSIALGTDEYPYPDWQYIELMAWRMPVLDECYRGHSIMDWYDDKDRYDLVTKCKTWCGVRSVNIIIYIVMGRVGAVVMRVIMGFRHIRTFTALTEKGERNEQ